MAHPKPEPKQKNGVDGCDVFPSFTKKTKQNEFTCGSLLPSKYPLPRYKCRMAIPKLHTSKLRSTVTPAYCSSHPEQPPVSKTNPHRKRPGKKGPIRERTRSKYPANSGARRSKRGKIGRGENIQPMRCGGGRKEGTKGMRSRENPANQMRDGRNRETREKAEG